MLQVEELGEIPGAANAGLETAAAVERLVSGRAWGELDECP